MLRTINLLSHRPAGFSGEGDRFLLPAAKELQRLLIAAQGSLQYATLRLPKRSLEELAGVSVEFAEDIHNSTGIWNSLERYNLDFFGTPLPFVLGPGETVERGLISRQRVHHLLWVFYSELNPDLVVSPTHRDLKLLSIVIADFLASRFARIPRGSGVKAFLAQPNRFGWNVKKKLLWLGRHSYLFRNRFRNYLAANAGKPEIPVTDDFVCEQATCWSGLGVIDILAETLDITPEQRSDLRSWYDRHLAYYRVLAIKGPRMEVLNAVNDKPYTVMMGEGPNPFQTGQVVAGSLVPWGKEWYWSGQQLKYDGVTDEALRETSAAVVGKSPRLAYRYCDELAEKAKKAVNRYYEEFVKYHGDDLAAYADGLSMAADLQREFRLQWAARPPEVVARVMQERKLPHPWPTMSFPPELLEEKHGVGVYFDRDEGQELMRGFSYIVSGLNKKGVGLTADEEEAIRAFVTSEQVSPEFVRRVVQEHGPESIKSAFLIRNVDAGYYLDYLLRRYKGAYYRKRYPRLAFVPG